MMSQESHQQQLSGNKWIQKKNFGKSANLSNMDFNNNIHNVYYYWKIIL